MFNFHPYLITANWTQLPSQTTSLWTSSKNSTSAFQNNGKYKICSRYVNVPAWGYIEKITVENCARKLVTSASFPISLTDSATDIYVLFPVRYYAKGVNTSGMKNSMNFEVAFRSFAKGERSCKQAEIEIVYAEMKIFCINAGVWGRCLFIYLRDVNNCWKNMGILLLFVYLIRWIIIYKISRRHGEISIEDRFIYCVCIVSSRRL